MELTKRAAGHLIKLAMAGVGLAGALSASAATFTWNGGGGNLNWSTGGNWNGGSAPTSSSDPDLIFMGSTNIGTSGSPLNQNIATPFKVNSITFASGAGSFFLGGNQLELDQGSTGIVQSSSSADSIANAILLGSKENLTLATTSGTPGLVTLSGTISEASSSGSNHGSLTVSSGIWALSGTNTYSGGTNLNGGILIVGSTGALGSGSFTFSGGTFAVGSGVTWTQSVTIPSGGTFAGIGTYTPGSSISIASGRTLAPGINDGTHAIGTLSLGNAVSFSSGSTFAVDVGAGANNADKLAVTGTATIASGANISVNASSPDQGKYVLLTSTGTLVGTFTGTAPSGYKFVYSSNELDLQHLADQTLVPSASVLSALAGISVNVSGTLTNTAPTNSALLNISLANNGGTLTVGSLSTTPSGSTLAAGSSDTVNGTITSVGAAGLGKTWSVKNTDASAVTTTASMSGTINVYSAATLSVSPTTSTTLGNGSSITYTNTTTGTPAGAKVTTITTTQGLNGTWSESGLTLNSTVVNNGSPVTASVSFDKTNLLNGATSTGSFTTAFTNSAPDGSAMLGASAGDVGSFTWTLQQAAVTGNVAPIDRAGGRLNLGTTQTADIAPSGSFAGLSSTVNAAAAGGGNRQVLGTTASILGGVNSSVTNPVLIGMAWRARLTSEQYAQPDSEVPTLVSDVVNVTGSGSGTTYVLQMSYDSTTAAAAGMVEAGLQLGAFNGSNWVAATSLNTGNNATSPQQQFLGSFAAFQAIYGTNLANYVGAYGVDTTAKTAWAVVDQNSQFAVIPEPASLALLGVGAAGLLTRRKRR